MAFKLGATSPVSLESPEAMIRDVRTKKIPGLLSHQADVLRDYVEHALAEPDVALQLPTGSGKTLVGLTLGEWRRRKNGERVVYLCQTNQLVHQVVDQAVTQYGLKATPFTGKKSEYAPAAKSAYLSAESVAVTSYSALFNVRPFFEDPHLIILDDAHGAEQYIASFWSLRVERRDYDVLHGAIVALLRPVLPPTDFQKLLGGSDSPWDYSWVEKIPTPLLAPLIPELVSLLDEHTEGTDLRYPWSVLRDHATACHLYISPREILLRPLLPPTSTHGAFTGARQRVYMSATLGEGGELERLTGRTGIHRLRVPPGWDRQGIGRRLFLFPEASLGQDEIDPLRLALIQAAKRALILTPDDTTASGMRSLVATGLGIPTFGPREIEQSKSAFVSTDRAVAVVANRYDGIDFKEDECRLCLVEGLPRAMNLQERFLVTRMGAVALLNDRILTRVVQAFGRCTRTPTDYAAVIIGDEELHTYLLTRDRRAYMHPELQAELEFGIAQSRDARQQDFLENLRLFLAQGTEWLAADADIVSRREALTQLPLPGTKALAAAAPFEVAYQRAMWRGAFEDALEQARKVITALGNDEELKAYFAMWNYLAGSAAWLASESGVERLRPVARSYFRTAGAATHGVRWLHAISRQGDSATPESAQEPGHALALVERLEGRLEALGTVNDKRFDREEKFILDNLAERDSKKFEQAHERLGRLLGFDAGNKESSAAPDPWWIVDEGLCFVFEDHSNAEATSRIGANKAREAASHPNWMRAELGVREDATVISVLLSPVGKVDRGAVPHLKGLFYWNLADFRAWARRSLATIRELRRTFAGAGDLVWRAEAVDAYRRSEIDADGIRARLRPAAEVLQPE